MFPEKHLSINAEVRLGCILFCKEDIEIIDFPDVEPEVSRFTLA
jgi:hypothetical protein